MDLDLRNCVLCYDISTQASDLARNRAVCFGYRYIPESK